MINIDLYKSVIRFYKNTGIFHFNFFFTQLSIQVIFRKKGVNGIQ